MRGLSASPYTSPCRNIPTWDVCIPCHSSYICSAELNGGPVPWLRQAQPFQLHSTRLWLPHGLCRMLPQAWDINVTFWLCHCWIWLWIMRVADHDGDVFLAGTPGTLLQLHGMRHWREHPGCLQDSSSRTWYALTDCASCILVFLREGSRHISRPLRGVSSQPMAKQPGQPAVRLALNPV